MNKSDEKLALLNDYLNERLNSIASHSEITSKMSAYCAGYDDGCEHEIRFIISLLNSAW